MSTNTFHLLLDAFAAEWPEGTPPSQRLVLLWLAKFADATTGKTFVSRERLAKDTGLSLRATKAAVTDLATLGHITIKPRAHGRFDVITVHPIRGATVAPQEEEGNSAEVQILPSEVQKTTPRGATVAHISSHHRLSVDDDDRDIRAADSRPDITDLVNYYTDVIKGAWMKGSRPGAAFAGKAYPEGTIRQHLTRGVDPSWLVAIVTRCLNNPKNTVRAPIPYLGGCVAKFEGGLDVLSQEEIATFERLEDQRLGKQPANAVVISAPTNEDDDDEAELEEADNYYVNWLSKAGDQRGGTYEIEEELIAAFAQASGWPLDEAGQLDIHTAKQYRAAGDWMKKLFEREKRAS